MSRDPNTRLAYSTGGEHEAEPSATEDRSAERRGRRGVVRRGSPPLDKSQTRLRLERRAGNRVATLVTGLPGGPQDAAALVRELRVACAAGGAYKEGVLELQGDQREQVERVLQARGIPSKRAGG